MTTETATGVSNLEKLLTESAHAENRRQFFALVEGVDWATRSPAELAKAIDLALSLEMSSLAIKLAQLGGQLFPDHERLQRAARVLAPPVVRRSQKPRIKGLAASRNWFRDHASLYRGQWVAVREGKLLAAAASLKELKTMIEPNDDPISTIIDRIL
jgi:hypothetical protein